VEGARAKGVKLLHLFTARFSETGRGAAQGLRFSEVVSYGNALDLNEAHFLDYFAEDPEPETRDPSIRNAVFDAREELASGGVAIHPDIERAAAALGRYVRYLAERGG